MGDPGQVIEEGEVGSLLRAVDLPVRQALVASLGWQLGGEAHAVAMEYAWSHADQVRCLESPVGYLYRVGCSGVRVRRKALPLYAAPSEEPPEFEPALTGALVRLPERQRVAVFLVVGCGWPAAEVGRVYELSESTVRAHVQSGLAGLRAALGVEADDG
jgi:DNA-directed RNA polymerase specialized sigma24 family protein